MALVLLQLSLLLYALLLHLLHLHTLLVKLCIDLRELLPLLADVVVLTFDDLFELVYLQSQVSELDSLHATLLYVPHLV